MIENFPISEQSPEIVKNIIMMSGGSSNDIPDGNVDIELGRAGLEKLGTLVKLKDEVKIDSVNINGIPGESICTLESKSGRVVLFLHGGAYLFGSVNTHRGLAADIGESCKSRVVVPAYRLAPENPFPAALNDAVSAYMWLLAEGYSPENIIISGDSAGGGLAMAMLLKLKEQYLPMPAAAAVMSPWVKLDVTTNELISRYRGLDVSHNDLNYKAAIYAGGTPLNDPLISPIYGELAGLPPMLIQVGGNERLLEDSLLLYSRLIKCGVSANIEIWDGMFHVFQAFASFLPEGMQALERIGHFVDKHCV